LQIGSEEGTGTDEEAFDSMSIVAPTVRTYGELEGKRGSKCVSPVHWW